eukprot:COSAG01_NODE_3348_length_6224_cov_43.028245_6_plen_185_part_00
MPGWLSRVQAHFHPATFSVLRPAVSAVSMMMPRKPTPVALVLSGLTPRLIQSQSGSSVRLLAVLLPPLLLLLLRSVACPPPHTYLYTCSLAHVPNHHDNQRVIRANDLDDQPSASAVLRQLLIDGYAVPTAPSDTAAVRVGELYSSCVLVDCFVFAVSRDTRIGLCRDHQQRTRGLGLLYARQL